MKNIIFDVDGTLWDTTEVVARAWNRAISEVGGTEAVISAAILKREFGKTMDIIANNLFYDAGAEKRAQLMRQCYKYEHEDLIESTENLLFPHVKETLRKLLEKHKLFIVSNCQCGYIELFMKKAGIGEYITDFECFGNTGKSKGENIRLLMERNEIEDAVYVGDTQGDYEATVLAGIPFVYARYGFGSVESYDLAIDDIQELLGIAPIELEAINVKGRNEGQKNMNSKAVKLERITVDSKEKFENLMSIYLHDLSEFADDLKVNEKGKFEYEGLDFYFKSEDLNPFFITYQDEVAGFVLLNTGKYVPKDVNYIIHELFLLKGYRKQGVGSAAIKSMLELYKGKYKVVQLSKNKLAVDFWTGFFDKQGIQYIESKEIDHDIECNVQMFEV